MTGTHALAETAATYGAENTGSRHTKLSISLPADLVAELRAAAEASGLGVSGVVAAALRQSIAASKQLRLDRALDEDAEENERWANDALALTARAWANLKW